MSQNLTISDDLYRRLDITARGRGLSIEELLRSWTLYGTGDIASDLRARRDAIQRSVALYEQLQAHHGLFPDSTDLLREDRSR